MYDLSLSPYTTRLEVRGDGCLLRTMLNTQQSCKRTRQRFLTDAVKLLEIPDSLTVILISVSKSKQLQRSVLQGNRFKGIRVKSKAGKYVEKKLTKIIVCINATVNTEYYTTTSC